MAIEHHLGNRARVFALRDDIEIRTEALNPHIKMVTSLYGIWYAILDGYVDYAMEAYMDFWLVKRRRQHITR